MVEAAVKARELGSRMRRAGAVWCSVPGEMEGGHLQRGGWRKKLGQWRQ